MANDTTTTHLSRPILDVDHVRSHFPAFGAHGNQEQSFFENAGGSFACAQTIDAMHRYYTETKVQPYAQYLTSATAGEQMDRSRVRWAEALGVAVDELQFGPSTSMNTYVLANAFGQVLSAQDDVIVTNQDHEANTGAVRRMAQRVGATLHEWRVDSETGLLDIAGLEALLSERTALVCFPQCSNLVGQENDVAAITAMAHAVGARVICDAVSYAPHGFDDVGALGCDVYLFSLYKTFSVHQGLMVTQNGILDALPNQGHGFNEGYPSKRLTPAGPDHAQEASAGAVLDYVEALHAHHGGSGGLRSACADVSALWQDHEERLLQPVLSMLGSDDRVRLLGRSDTGGDGHRCPTVAFVPRGRAPETVAAGLVGQGVQAGHGDFYAGRLLEGVDVDPATGVVRVSWVHYTNDADVNRLVTALDQVL